ncbi:MAG: hypothetical protein QNJ55_19520 [Xenococcus sp. MO_188.B8]|nr:hypothetical protein [Xenococcus sp. MO_188.B8]
MSEPILLLPQLKADADVKSGDRPGEWNLQGSKTFGDVATSLSYESPGAVKNISSVPTMWARPLTLEMVLYDQQHSLRAQMVEEWQGMLAAISLAELRGFPITAQLIELGKLQQKEDFARSLYELLPDFQGRNLYTLDGKNPWEDIYIFLWDKKPIGMTSPSTIVVPSEEGNWDGLPWWNSSEQRLRSPISHLNKNEQALLWCWLDNLNKALNNHGGDMKAINIMKGLLGDFQGRLTRIPEQTLTLSDNPVFFEVAIKRGVLEALNYPVKAPERDSSVQLIPSREKLDPPKLPLLIYDPEIAKIWGENPQNIWIHRGKTLAALRPEELPNLKEQWSPEVILVEPKDLFLPELKFIDQDDALPGALLPEFQEPLVFNNQRITPLIPLNSLLLDYLSPEALLKKIIFQTCKTAEGIKIRVTLDLPLSGVKDDTAYENYRLYKDYDLKEENSLGDQLPVLQIWPHFRKADWQEYYIFYYDGELGEQTFQVTCPEAKYAHSFQEGFGTFQMYSMESFPEYLPCTDFNHEPIGLILCQSPPIIVRPHNSWQVGVDFGTSFTNIYVNDNQIPKPLKPENLQLQVTKPPRETRINVLFENFIPENFIPEDKPLPISSVLTTRGKNINNKKMFPILDARMYIPDNLRFRPQESWMKTNLKWELDNRLDNEVFLKHLALHITALAAKAEVNQIKWVLSYPSAFSKGDILNYSKVWSDLTKELAKNTGIKQNFPDIESDFRTESLAIAQYFADFEDRDLVYSTCIDMGGRTSDISIWENNRLVHQCSVQLAGRDIFSQFLKLNTKFAEQKLGLASRDWKGLGDGAFNAKLDVWLRLKSQDWLADQRALLEEDEEFQGLVQLTTLGFAGLYYYVGILLKTLYKTGKYNREQITPVYLGGNASRFINWLDSRGNFDRYSELNELLSRMLSKGSSFDDTEEITNLSQNPKDEAACGLVMSDTKLKGLGRKVKDPIISGEAYEINGTKFPSDSRIDFIIDKEADEEIENVEKFKIPQLEEVPKFLYEYHKAIRDLDLESILPLKGYKRSKKQSDNSKLWQATQRELEKTLLTIKGDSKKIRPESTFILGLKAMLKVLGKQWAEK